MVKKEFIPNLTVDMVALKNFKSPTLFKSPVAFSLVLLLLIAPLTAQQHWVGTWATAPQLVEPNNMPPSPGLNNNSLRQIVRVSIGGDTIRLRISNEFSSEPTVLKSVQIAKSLGGHLIDVTTNKELKFNGNSEVVMAPYSAITSDPIAFHLEPRMDVAITIYYGQTSPSVTGHPGSRTTSYIIAGNNPNVTDFSGAITTDHWYNINAIEVLAPLSTASVAILGNSITDGRGSTTNMQNRWPDIFSECLLKNQATKEVGVLNLGIGGNCVLSGGLGPTALSRFDRDILGQAGVRWIIVFIGVNDIGTVKTAEAATTIANNLISAYKQMIKKAHNKNIRIYGATITPFKGNSYYNQYSESCRQMVNQWIRTKGNFDACIDFDKIMRDPLDTLKLISSYQNDGLHPDAEGYRKMGESIDLNLFIGGDTLFQKETGLQWFWFEAERFVQEGSNFNILLDPLASNGKYIVVKTGIQALTNPPTDPKDYLNIPFSVNKDTTYYIFARVNCPTYNDDSFWLRIDNGTFTYANNLVTSGWAWVKLNSYFLLKGNHTLTISYREDGACLDKICVTNDDLIPYGLGEIDSAVLNIKSNPRLNSYYLGQNYPNPFNSSTVINFTLPESSKVKIDIYDMQGRLVQTATEGYYLAGDYRIALEANRLPAGIYFYHLKAENFSCTKKMVLIK